MVHVVTFDPLCVLCHGEVEPYRFEVCDRITPTEKPWMESLLCWFNSSRQNQWPRREEYYTFPVDLTRAEWRTYYRLRDRWPGMTNDEYLCREGPSCSRCCRDNRRANIVHVICVKQAFKKIPHLTISTLSQIALLTRPPVESYTLSLSMDPTELLQPFPPASALADTELARLINLIRTRLPPELHIEIVKYLKIHVWAGGNFYRNQAMCLAILDQVVPKLLPEFPQRDREPSLPLAGFETIEKLGINKVKIMDEMCVTLVGSDNSTVYDEEIRLESQDIVALQVARGRYGIVGLRLYYTDRLYSPWLGGMRRKRVHTYAGTDLKLLQTASDGHRLFRLDLRDATEADSDDETYPRYDSRRRRRYP